MKYAIIYFKNYNFERKYNMKVETDMDTYLNLKDSIEKLMPSIHVQLIAVDDMLRKLGFVQTTLCTIEIQATDDQIEELRDICYQFEIDAFNTLDGCDPPKSNPNYIKYEKYTWIADWLYSVLRKN
ncbi:hypothetical protein [Clostridium botulinum]|uniref:hypothetical protein n=1 Tax=Clostridium botulinum TaxID=1491 RepID=UPI001FA7F98D|nr:hypothetical protein [Clostridium botulinum]